MSDDRIDIGIVGDIMACDSPLLTGRGVFSSCQGDYRPLFAGLAEFAQRHDFLIGNFEGVLVERLPTRSPQKMSMKMPAAILPALLQCRFRYLSIANNHVMEYGPEAFHWMCDQFANHGITPFGHKESPAIIFQHPGSTLRIGLLAFSTVPAHHGHVPEYYYLNHRDPAAVRHCMELVRQTKAHCDYLFLFPHWGSEFMPNPAPWQIAWARQLIDQGTDAIFGAHPHRIQTACRMDDKPVCFSLGNLISDYFQERLKKSLVVSARLEKSASHYSARNFSYDRAFVLFELPDARPSLDESLGNDPETLYVHQAHKMRSEVRGEMIRHLLRHPLGWIFNRGMWRWLAGRALFIARHHNKIKANPDHIYSQSS